MAFKKRSKKENRAEKALIELIELYLRSGKPVGSEALKESAFKEISSATLRNYFAAFEKEGYLVQPHISGGRVPTHKAWRLYIEEALSAPQLEADHEMRLRHFLTGETKHVASFLHKSAQLLSEICELPVFISSVRFDQDFILDVKLVSIDRNRLLCVLITHFGQIFTETLFVDQILSSGNLKRLERYFHWKLASVKDKSEPSLNDMELSVANRIYKEFMTRYLAFYTNFSDDDVFRTGFSKLLAYPEFNDPLSLSAALSLFENLAQMRQLLNDCTTHSSSSSTSLRTWVGPELAPYGVTTSQAASIAIPYMIHHATAGAIGLLGPCRMPYKSLFATLTLFSSLLSQTLTKSLYRFKLSIRHPRSTFLVDSKWSHKLIEVKP